MAASMDRQLRIADHGDVLVLDHDGALAAHAGESWFGVAVAFRMLQAAAPVLSRDRLWDRKNLYVVSDHPGTGVRDAIDYVTRCVANDDFRLQDASAAPGCRGGMRFSWSIGDGDVVASLRLRDDFVPEAFDALLDRRGTPAQRPHDAEDFSALKQQLAERVWHEPPERLFTVAVAQAEVTRHA